MKEHHHVCTSCKPNHVDNCDRCFGFGFHKIKSKIGGHVIISASEATAWTGDYETCKECGGTPKGVVTMEENNLEQPVQPDKNIEIGDNIYIKFRVLALDIRKKTVLLKNDQSGLRLEVPGAVIHDLENAGKIKVID